MPIMKSLMRSIAHHGIRGRFSQGSMKSIYVSARCNSSGMDAKSLYVVNSNSLPRSLPIQSSYITHICHGSATWLGKRAFSTETSIEKEVESKLRDLIAKERVLLLLKGSPEAPQCGFSAAIVSILDKYKVSDYAYVDVNSHELLRPCAKKIANWPTFPQLYISGNFIGGCDIVQSMHDAGELAELLGVSTHKS